MKNKAGGWRHPPTYPVWDGQVMRAMRRMQHAREAKVVYVETSAGMAAVVMCDAGHAPGQPRSTARGGTYAYVRGDARRVRRELMRYACLLAEQMSAHNGGGRCTWEVVGPPPLHGMLESEKLEVVRERARYLRPRRGGGGWMERGKAISWLTSGLRTAVVMLPSARHAPDAAVTEGARSTVVAPAPQAGAGAR